MNEMLKTFSDILKPTVESDLQIEEYWKERCYGWVYDDNGNEMKLLSANLPENTFLVGVSEDETKHVSMDDVTTCPNSKSFEEFKENLFIFDVFDEDGVFNPNPMLMDLLSEIFVLSENSTVYHIFDKHDVFITDGNGMTVIFNKKDKTFFVSFLNEEYTLYSFDLAVKLSYEYNKTL